MPPTDTEITTARGAAWPIPVADDSAELVTGFEKVSEQMNETQQHLNFERAAKGAQLRGGSQLGA